MTFDQVQTLMNYGFTADQIMEISHNTPEAAPAPVQDQEPTPEPAPAPVQDQEPAPVPEAAPAPVQDNGPTIGDVLAGLTKLTNTIQANAIANSVIPQQRTESAEDMIAQIIRPTYKEREGR